MGLEHSIYLLGLPLLALPWLLRLIRPHRPQKIRFPQMYILDKVLKQNPLLPKPNPLWLNLIRMMAVLFLLFLLLGWLKPNERFHSDVSHILLMDDTFYSTVQGSGDSFITLEEALSEIPDGASVSVLGLSGRASAWGSPSSTLEEVSTWRGDYLSEDWSALGMSASRLLRLKPSPEVTMTPLLPIFTESPTLGEKVFQRFEDQWMRMPPYSNPVSSDRTFDPESFKVILGMSGEGMQLRVNPSTAVIRHRLLQEDGARGNWSEAPKASFELREVGAIEFEIDGEPLDMLTRYLSKSQGRGQRLVMLNHTEAPKRLQDSNYYLETVLKAAAGHMGLEFLSLPASAWKQLDVRRGDMLVMHNPSFLPKGVEKALRFALEKGAVLHLWPGPHFPVTTKTEIDWMPAQLMKAPGHDYKIQWPQTFSDAFSDSVGLSHRGGWMMKDLKSGADVIAHRDDGSPYWVRFTFGQRGGEVNLMVSPFHLFWSKSVLQPSYPLMAQAILEWGREASRDTQLEAGSPIPLGLTSSKTLSGKDGRGPYAVPGVHLWTDEAGEEEMVVVNFSPERLKKRHEVSIPDATRGPSSSGERLEGVRVDRWWAMALVLFLMVELMFLSWKAPRLLRQ